MKKLTLYIEETAYKEAEKHLQALLRIEGVDVSTPELEGQRIQIHFGNGEDEIIHLEGHGVYQKCVLEQQGETVKIPHATYKGYDGRD